MADNNLRLNYSSPLKRSDSDGKEHLQKDPIICNSEEKYSYKRSTNIAAEQVSEISICRDQSARSSRDPPAANEAKPVYGKKFRLLDQVKRKTKPPHDSSWPPAKHFKESQGNYKTSTEKMPSATDKRGVDSFVYNTKVHHSFYQTNSATQGDCSANEGHDQSIKVTEPFLCNNNSESTKHRYFEANTSVPKCPQKLKSQIQMEPRVRVRKPVHSVTVMPLSCTSSIADAEVNDKETNPLVSLGSYTASASETIKPKVLITESIRKASHAVEGKEQEVNLSKDTIPVEHHKPEKQNKIPLPSEQENQLKTSDYRGSFPNVPLQISKRKCVSPSPFLRESQSETEVTKRFCEDNICKDAEKLERHAFCPIINISKATPPPSPQPENQEAIQKHTKPRCSSRKYDSNKPQQMTIQGLANHYIVGSPQRSPRQSPRPYLNPPDEESTITHRRSPVCSPARNRSKSPFYMEDFKRHSKSPQSDWHPCVTHSTHTQSLTASNTNLTVSSERKSPFPYHPCGSPRPSGQSYGTDVLSKLSTPLLVITPPEFLCRENAHSPNPFQNLQSLSSESTGMEEKLSLCSPVSCFTKRPNVSEARNMNNLINARNPSQSIETQTEQNWLQSTQEKVNGTVKRKVSLNKGQEQFGQCLTRSPKCMRKDCLPPISANDAKRSHVTTKRLNKETTIALTNAKAITEEVDTSGFNRDIKSINLSYKTVAAKDISTQTTPTTVSKVGNKRDRKSELGINCKRSKENHQESWFPDTKRCHLSNLTEQELACSGNLISKTYFQSLNNGGNSDHHKQMTFNRQTDQQENLLNALHTIPAPFIYEWTHHMGNALELPKKQVSMNTNPQCRKHLLDSDIPVLNPQERRSCSPCLRPTMNSHYAIYNQKNLDKYNLEPGEYNAKDNCCFSKLPQICVAHQPGNNKDHIPKGQCQKLPPANYSNCNYHNVTSTGIITHEQGWIDSSNKNKKENTESKPLRFHLMTKFPVRDTTAHKDSYMSTTVKKDVENEKSALTKTNQSKIKRTADLAPVTGRTSGKSSGKKANAVRCSSNIQESESTQKKENVTNDFKNSSELDFNNISVPSTRRCVTPLGGLLTNHLQDSEITPKEAKLTSSSSMCDLKPVRNTFGESTTLSQENNKNNFDSVKQSNAKRRWKKLVRLCSLNNKRLNKRPRTTDVRIGHEQKSDKKLTDSNSSKCSDCHKEITTGSVMTKNEKLVCKKQKKVKDDANATRTEPSIRGRTPANNKEEETNLTANNADRNFDAFKTGSQTSSVQGITHYKSANNHKTLNIFLPKLLSISAKNVLQSKCVENQQENITPVKITASEELSGQFQNSTSPNVLSRRLLNTSSSKDLLNHSFEGSFTKKTMNKVNITSPLNTLAGKMSDSANIPKRNKGEFAEKSQMVTETSNASVRAAECGRLSFSENVENDASANLPKQHSLSNQPLTPIRDLLQLSLNSKTLPPVDKVSIPSAVYKSFEEKNTRPETKSNSNYKHMLGQSMGEPSSLKLNTQSKQMNLKQAQKNVKTTITTEISKIPAQNVENDIALKVNISSKLATNRYSPRPMEKGESHLNLFSECTPNTSLETKISNDQSTFQRNSIYSIYDKPSSSSEMETSFPDNQSINNYNQPIRSVSPRFATASSTSRILSDKNLLPPNLNDQVTIQMKQVKPVHTQQANKNSTPRCLSIASSRGSHFISYGKTTSVKSASSAQFEGESSMTRARSPWKMFSTTHGTSLSQTHLTYDDQFNSMGALANSKTTPITPYTTASQIMMSTNSFNRGMCATCTEKFITGPEKEIRAGSLTNVTWALLKDTQHHEAHADSSTKSNNDARTNSVPEDDTTNRRINTNNQSDISTNLTWLLTACPPNKFLSREIQTCAPNQLEFLSTLYNKEQQLNQQDREHHEHTTCQAGQNKTDDLPFSSVKSLRKTSTNAELTGKFAHTKPTHIADHYQQQSIENPVLDEPAGPEDCLPIINATFSLRDRPDIQEQLKRFGNQRQIEVDSSKVKCIEKISWVKGNLE